MAIFGLRFDLRVPEFAPGTVAERYRAAVDMAEWAERNGAMFVNLSEHHGSADGYLPSPLPVAAAMAARTSTIAISIAAIIAPLHDPLRLAEDIAVVDLLSGGRLSIVVANGYVRDEFDMFDVAMSERAARTTEAVTALKQAWTGEPFEHRGRTVQVRPRPTNPGGPAIILGGSSDAAARRAARIADGYQPSTPDSWEAYRNEVVALGRPDPGPHMGGSTATVFVAADHDQGWETLAPYAMHEVNAYGAWAEAAGLDTGYETFDDPEALRADGRYRVATPDELVAELTEAGDLGFFMLHPLLGGLPPEAAWESLRLLEHEVLPRI